MEGSGATNCAHDPHRQHERLTWTSTLTVIQNSDRAPFSGFGHELQSSKTGNSQPTHAVYIHNVWRWTPLRGWQQSLMMRQRTSAFSRWTSSTCRSTRISVHELKSKTSSRKNRIGHSSKYHQLKRNYSNSRSTVNSFPISSHDRLWNWRISQRLFDLANVSSSDSTRRIEKQLEESSTRKMNRVTPSRRATLLLTPTLYSFSFT